MSSSQLTLTPSFFRGVGQPPTRMGPMGLIDSDSMLPSGKPLHNYEKEPFLMGKSTISMTIFNSELLVYQRVFTKKDGNQEVTWPVPSMMNSRIDYMICPYSYICICIYLLGFEWKHHILWAFSIGKIIEANEWFSSTTLCCRRVKPVEVEELGTGGQSSKRLPDIPNVWHRETHPRGYGSGDWSRCFRLHENDSENSSGCGRGWWGWYPLVNLYIAMENHHF